MALFGAEHAAATRLNYYQAAQNICNGLHSRAQAKVAAAKLELEQLLMWQLRSAKDLYDMAETTCASLPQPLGGNMDESSDFTAEQQFQVEGTLHQCDEYRKSIWLVCSSALSVYFTGQAGHCWHHQNMSVRCLANKLWQLSCGTVLTSYVS